MSIHTFLISDQAGVEKDSQHAQFTDNSLGGLSPLLQKLGGLKPPLPPWFLRPCTMIHCSLLSQIMNQKNKTLKESRKICKSVKIYCHICLIKVWFALQFNITTTFFPTMLCCKILPLITLLYYRCTQTKSRYCTHSNNGMTSLIK